MSVLDGDILPPRRHTVHREQMDRAAPVKSVREQNNVNRPDQQVAILAFLQQHGRLVPVGGNEFTGGRSTGEVINGIGRERTPTAYASVSRSLQRLVRSGKIILLTNWLTVGRGYRYGVMP